MSILVNDSRLPENNNVAGGGPIGFNPMLQESGYDAYEVSISVFHAESLTAMHANGSLGRGVRVLSSSGTPPASTEPSRMSSVAWAIGKSLFKWGIKKPVTATASLVIVTGMLLYYGTKAVLRRKQEPQQLVSPIEQERRATMSSYHPRNET